ncbi:MAG: hypothetical protein ABIQ05_09775 [Candidatus Limnocylindria bacterium]
MASRVIAAIRCSAVLAAALSFIVPGLGQGWIGARRRAIIMAAPIMLLVGIVLLVVATQGSYRTAGLLIQPNVLIGLLVANVVLPAYRSGAIVDAFRLTRRGWPTPARIRNGSGRIARYQYWPPEIHKQLDIESVNLLCTMVRTPFK